MIDCVPHLNLVNDGETSSKEIGHSFFKNSGIALMRLVKHVKQLSPSNGARSQRIGHLVEHSIYFRDGQFPEPWVINRGKSNLDFVGLEVT